MLLSFAVAVSCLLTSPRLFAPANLGAARSVAPIVAVLGRRQAAQLGAAAAAGMLWHEQLPALAAAAAPEKWWTSELQRLGGLFFDPALASPSSDCGYTFCSWAGVRFVSDAVGTKSSSLVTIVGSDDGESFWTVKGRFLNATSSEFRVDFQPRGGPSALLGTVVGRPNARSISWQDGSTWRRVSKAPPAAALTVRPKLSSSVEGPFNDFKTPFNGTALEYVGDWIAPPPWPGSNLRIFSDRLGNLPSEDITVVGCDTPGEGCGLWFTLRGRWLDRAAGRLTVDFSKKGGPSDLRGVFDGAGSVRWDDGNLYSRLEFTQK
tara:strand:+ start:33 stop:992 length:960 start_codon:yes stop_codon:yes gene_type:complete